MTNSAGLPARGTDYDDVRPAGPLAKSRFAEGNNVNPDNSLENVIMKSPEIKQRNDVAVGRAKRPLKSQKLKSKQKGLTIVEYAVGGSLITAAAVAAFTLLGANVAAVINFIAGVITVPAGG